MCHNMIDKKTGKGFQCWKFRRSRLYYQMFFDVKIRSSRSKQKLFQKKVPELFHFHYFCGINFILKATFNHIISIFCGNFSGYTTITITTRKG